MMMMKGRRKKGRERERSNSEMVLTVENMFYGDCFQCLCVCVCVCVCVVECVASRGRRGEAYPHGGGEGSLEVAGDADE